MRMNTFHTIRTELRRTKNIDEIAERAASAPRPALDSSPRIHTELRRAVLSDLAPHALAPGTQIRVEESVVRSCNVAIRRGQNIQNVTLQDLTPTRSC
jgi:hypothetical protein